MNKFPELLWTKLNKIKIQNNRDHPPKALLDKLGITLQEFIFFKWKKYKELKYTRSPSKHIKEKNNNKDTRMSGEWRGTFRMRWHYNK